jgi:hypothetical protein
MNLSNLAQIRECVAHGDRAGALRTLRVAIEQDQIGAHDGVELMLALRRGSPEKVMEAVEAIERGLPGAYRFVPKADYAFA